MQLPNIHEGDILLRHINGRFGLLRDGKVSMIAFRDGGLVIHTQRMVDDAYLVRMKAQNAADEGSFWAEVPVTTDIEFANAPFIWPLEPFEIPPPPPDEQPEPTPEPPPEPTPDPAPDMGGGGGG